MYTNITPVCRTPEEFPSNEFPNNNFNNGFNKLTEKNKLTSSILYDNETEDVKWNINMPPKPINSNEKYIRVGCIGDNSCLFHAILKSTSPLYVSSYKIKNTITEKDLYDLEIAVNNYIVFPDHLFNKERKKNNMNTIYVAINEKEINKITSKWRTKYAQLLREEIARRIISDTNLQDLIYRRLSTYIEIIRDNIKEKNNMSESELWKVSKSILFSNMIDELNSLKEVRPDYAIIILEILDIDMYLVYDKGMNSKNPKELLYGGSALHYNTRGPKNMRLPTSIHYGKQDRQAIVLLTVNDNHYELIGKEIMENGKRKVIFKFDNNEPIIKRLYNEIKSE